MNDDLSPDIVGLLTRDYGFRKSGDYLRRGKCPACGETELFTSASKPWVLKCGRENKCGWTATVRDLYKDLFGRLNERFPPSSEHPNATADAYLASERRLKITGIRDWYRQGIFRHRYGNRPTATVLFEVATGVWMERLIEPVTVTEPKSEPKLRKAHFVGEHKGLWWQPPGFEIADKEELWLVEGCIDAISLHSVGIKAVATLSAGNYPEKMLANLAAANIRPRLIWALDNDRAGVRAIERHVERARKGWDDGRVPGFHCRAALIPQSGTRKVDWNDALSTGDLTPQDIKRCRYEGDLLLAPSALEKGLLYWRWNREVSFSIEFGSSTWWWEINPVNYAATIEVVSKEPEYLASDEEDIRWEAAKRTAVVYEIANACFRFLYFQKSSMTDDSWYYARITYPHSNYEIKDTFTGAQIATGSEFKKRLLAIAPGAVFTGTTHQLNWIIKKHMASIKIVDTVDFIGYSKQHRAYIFPTVAVSGGQVYPMNTEDFFEVGKISVKSLNHSLQLQIGTRREYQPDWLKLVYDSFGAKGIVATAFFLGSLFAEQIREMHKSYPFLEIAGEASAGKSTLIEFLWKLVGRNDYEGFDPNKSTLAARARNMSQVSNLPVSFIESDRSGPDTVKQKQFDWDELKTAYNGRPSRATGIANGGNDTKEPPFRGSILISQNAPVNSSDAIMQRIIHQMFDTSSHTAASKVAADKLAALPVEAVSHFLILATMAEAKIVKMVADRAPVYEAELAKNPKIRSVRICKNHGQMKALVDALAELTDMPADWLEETKLLLSHAAQKRQEAIASDHPMIEEFWDMIDYLGLDRLSHCSPVNGEIALNLNQVIAEAARANQSVPAQIDLKRHLKESRSHPFVKIGTVRSIFYDRESNPNVPETLKCWIFKAPKEDRS